MSGCSFSLTRSAEITDQRGSGTLNLRGKRRPAFLVLPILLLSQTRGTYNCTDDSFFRESGHVRWQV